MRIQQQIVLSLRDDVKKKLKQALCVNFNVLKMKRSQRKVYQVKNIIRTIWGLDNKKQHPLNLQNHRVNE